MVWKVNIKKTQKLRKFLYKFVEIWKVKPSKLIPWQKEKKKKSRSFAVILGMECVQDFMDFFFLTARIFTGNFVWGVYEEEMQHSD